MPRPFISVQIRDYHNISGKPSPKQKELLSDPFDDEDVLEEISSPDHFHFPIYSKGSFVSYQRLYIVFEPGFGPVNQITVHPFCKGKMLKKVLRRMHAKDVKVSEVESLDKIKPSKLRKILRNIERADFLDPYTIMLTGQKRGLKFPKLPLKVFSFFSKNKKKSS